MQRGAAGQGARGAEPRAAARRRPAAVSGEARRGPPRAEAVRRGREGAAGGGDAAAPTCRAASTTWRSSTSSAATAAAARGRLRGRSGRQPEELRRAVQPRQAAAEGGPAARGDGAVPGRGRRAARSSPRAICTWPRRCSTAATCQGAAQAATEGLSQKPDRAIAPLGHYVLADVYSRMGRENEAAREVARARALERGR